MYNRIHTIKWYILVNETADRSQNLKRRVGDLIYMGIAGVII